MCLYLITTIQKLQSASEDKDTQEWNQHTQSYFKGEINQPQSEFLTKFFQKVIQKVGLIQRQIVALNQKSMKK